MRSRLIYPYDQWKLVLPPELMEFAEKCMTARPGFPKKVNDKWSHVPQEFKPKILTRVSDAFFQAVKEGRDTRDIGTFTNDNSLMEVMGFLVTDPSGLVEILSRPTSDMAVLTSFLSTAFAQAEAILNESNMQDGILDNKLLATKAKILSNVKGQVESVIRLKKEVIDRHTDNHNYSLITPSKAEGDEAITPEFILADNIEDVRDKDKRVNLIEPDVHATTPVNSTEVASDEIVRQESL